jgi:hypothetical protein
VGSVITDAPDRVLAALGGEDPKGDRHARP